MCLVSMSYEDADADADADADINTRHIYSLLSDRLCMCLVA